MTDIAKGLSGLRVLEIAEMAAAPYAAKLLADLGAEVIKVEAPGGDPARLRGPFPAAAPGDPEQSGLFLGLNTNKSSVVLDLTNAVERERLADLVDQADIVVHSLPAQKAAEYGLDGPTLLAKNRSLVICAITPFGHTGPHAGWAAEELNVVHGGGWGYLIPGDAADTSEPPLTVFGHPANCQAGMAGAFAALGALFKARRTGIGEFIDLSVMSHVAAMLEASFIAWSYVGKTASRAEGRLLNPWGIFRCSDGLIFLVTVEQDQWERLVEMMGSPEWAQLEVFADPPDRSANRDLLAVYIQEWTSQHTVEELFHQGQAQRICFAPVFTPADLADQEHLAERGFFHSVDHPVAGPLAHMGSPARVTPNPWRLDRAAPTLNSSPSAQFSKRPTTTHPLSHVPGTRDNEVESLSHVPGTRDNDAESLSHVPGTRDNEVSRPLEGIRIIDFSWVWAGPFATLHLAYLGAEVIKIESSSRPGLGRRLAVHPPDLEATLNTCGYFNQWDQGKKSVELDLSNPESIATVLDLVATADVVLDNYATGVMDRLGLGDDVLRSANPEIIITSVTGFGHTGPLRNYMGYGPTTAPLSGLTSMTGHPGGPAAEAGISFGDPAAGLAAAFSTMASLVTRAQDGVPSRIDTSLWEATAVNAVEGWMTHALGSAPLERMGSRSLTAAPHGVFPCLGDDQWVSIACMTDMQWQSFAELIGSAANDDRFATAAGRKANEVELEQLVCDYTSQHEAWHITRELQAQSIASYPSLSCPDLEHNEQLVARRFWERFDHPEVGERTHSGVPWITHNWANGVTGRAPLLGEHTAEILGSSK